MRGRYEWENYALGFATFSFFGDFVASVQDVPRSVSIKNEVISPGAFERKLNPKQMGRINDRGVRVGPSEAARSLAYGTLLLLTTHENTTDPEMPGIPIGTLTDWEDLHLDLFPICFDGFSESSLASHTPRVLF